MSAHYRYVLLHDKSRCIGCQACEVHCKTNKQLGAGPAPGKIILGETRFENGLPRQDFTFMPCFQCAAAWCMQPCPTGALQRRTDGIIALQSSLCIGCQNCIAACPWGTPQWDPNTRRVVKCDYCYERVEQGLQPACVTKCVTQCLSFERIEITSPAWATVAVTA